MQQGPVTVQIFYTPAEAQLAGSVLESQGINYIIADLLAGQIIHIMIVGLGGLRLQVALEDLADARELLGIDESGADLKRPEPAERIEDENPADTQARLAYLSAILAIPFMAGPMAFFQIFFTFYSIWLLITNKSGKTARGVRWTVIAVIFNLLIGLPMAFLFKLSIGFLSSGY